MIHSRYSYSPFLGEKMKIPEMDAWTSGCPVSACLREPLKLSCWQRERIPVSQQALAKGHIE
jgi:hypothetical protein